MRLETKRMMDIWNNASKAGVTSCEDITIVQKVCQILKLLSLVYVAKGILTRHGFQSVDMVEQEGFQADYRSHQ